MRSLTDLVGSDSGRAFLAERGVFLDVASFGKAMAAPFDDRIREAVGAPAGTRLPYFGQQLQCDYSHAVTAKLRVAQSLGRYDNVTPVSLPLDVDRAGSSRWNTTLSWPTPAKPPTVRIIPNRVAEMEMRFAPVESARLRTVIETVDGWLRSWAGPSGPADAVRARQAHFVEALTRPEPHTLSDANLALTQWLLRDALDYQPPTMLVSRLLDLGFVTATLNNVVANIDDVVAVFNEATAELMAADVDPQVHHLAPNYLPLRYACPQDGKRCLLVRERSGADTFAVATCRFCGTTHRFHLGSQYLDVGTVAATGRWATDVTLPLYVNALTSGVIAGQSTALYGLVLNRVLLKVLGETPVPMLVPPELGDASSRGSDSLFFDCLTGAA